MSLLTSVNSGSGYRRRSHPQSDRAHHFRLDTPGGARVVSRCPGFDVGFRQWYWSPDCEALYKFHAKLVSHTVTRAVRSHRKLRGDGFSVRVHH